MGLFIERIIRIESKTDPYALSKHLKRSQELKEQIEVKARQQSFNPESSRDLMDAWFALTDETSKKLPNIHEVTFLGRLHLSFPLIHR